MVAYQQQQVPMQQVQQAAYQTSKFWDAKNWLIVILIGVVLLLLIGKKTVELPPNFMWGVVILGLGFIGYKIWSSQAKKFDFWEEFKKFQKAYFKMWGMYRYPAFRNVHGTQVSPLEFLFHDKKNGFTYRWSRDLGLQSAEIISLHDAKLDFERGIFSDLLKRQHKLATIRDMLEEQGLVSQNNNLDRQIGSVTER